MAVNASRSPARKLRSRSRSRLRSKSAIDSVTCIAPWRHGRFPNLGRLAPLFKLDLRDHQSWQSLIPRIGDIIEGQTKWLRLARGQRTRTAAHHERPFPRYFLPGVVVEHAIDLDYLQVSIALVRDVTEDLDQSRLDVAFGRLHVHIAEPEK